MFVFTGQSNHTRSDGNWCDYCSDGEVYSCMEGKKVFYNALNGYFVVNIILAVISLVSNSSSV